MHIRRRVEAAKSEHARASPKVEVQVGAEVPVSPDILFSLRRSTARRLILRWLCTQGPSYAAEIGRATGLDAPATIGALRGIGQRYAGERSLLGLGLVMELPSGRRGIKAYEPTALGRMALQRLGG